GYLVASSLTVETRLSPASRLAPTGTSRARPAISWACSTGVRGWVEVVVARVVRRAVADLRLVVRRVVRRVVLLRVAGLPPPWLLVVAIWLISGLISTNTRL